MKAIFQKRWLKNLFIGIEIILLLCTVGLAIYNYYLEKKLIPQYEKILQKKLDNQLTSINNFLDKESKKIDELSKDKIILNFIKTPKSEQEASLASHAKKLQGNLGFKSLTLIGNNGTVLFSTNQLLQHLELNNERYSNTPLYLSFYVSSTDLVPNFSHVFFDAILNESAFYITAPLFYDQKTIGIIALQIDVKELHTITREHLDLGRTGEILLAAQSGPEAYFITPPRNNPSRRFTKVSLFSEKNPSAIQRATNGETGKGIVVDYLGKKVLAAWSYIPKVSWGVVVKINLEEINSTLKIWRNYFWLAAMCALLFGIFLIIIYRTYLAKKVSILSHKMSDIAPNRFRYFMLLIILIFIYFTGLSVFDFKYDMQADIKSSQKYAIEAVKKGIQSIDTDLEKIRKLADRFAKDLETAQLISSDIEKLMRREIVEIDGLVRITVANENLEAQSIAQTDDGVIKKEMIEEEGIAKTEWFSLPMETKKPHWLNPSFDSMSKSMVITYSRPFFFKNDQSSPAGVISINYKLSDIAQIVQNIGVGPTGYSFLVAKDGTFLYHPIQQNTLEKKTLLQFAHEEGNGGLEQIANKLKFDKPIQTEFLNQATQSTSYIYTHPINITGWTLATVFSSNEVGLSELQIREHIFIIIIFVTITLLIISFAFAIFYAKNKVFSFFNLSNLILFLALLTLWYTIEKTFSSETEAQILVTDQASANKFVSREIEEAKRKNYEVPIAIPCGVELFALEQTAPTRVSVSGYIWHKYHKVWHKDIKRGIRINEAISYTVLNENITSEGDWEVVGANITATIYQMHNYRPYPFDQYHLVVPLEHTDLSKNILLVPDLASYVSIDPQKLPGLETNFSKNSVFISETFYNYTPYVPNSDWGVRKFQEMTDQYRLAFNTIMKNDLLVPFIYFCLPLLVMLISIFVTLVLERRDTSPFTLIGPYTALLFSLVLLHRSLHEAAPTVGMVYFEYAFLYTYIILILLIIHALLLQWFAKNDFYQTKFVPILKIIFWPIQLVAWIITTIVIFI